jgi:hypothetical protein
MTSSPTIAALFLILTVSPDATVCVALILQLAVHSFQLLPFTTAGHGKLHTTPPSDEPAAEQVCPTTVHGLFPVPEQATILEVVPLMSIVD